MTNKSPGMTTGLLLGLGIGGLAGILLAPRKGEETRRQIQQKATVTRDRIKQQFSKQGAKVKEGLDKAADTSRKVASTAENELTRATSGAGPGKGGS